MTGRPTRASFRDELDRVQDQLVIMTGQVELAMSRATTALLDADAALASWVMAGDRHVDTVKREIDAACLQLLARQQPVATDLRVVVTALTMAADLERMGDLAAHVAKVAAMRTPSSAVPTALRGTVLGMAGAAEAVVAKAGSIMASRDITRAVELEADDDVVDRLQQDLFRHLLADNWPYGVEVAVDLTLLGRYYERYADHAVRLARQVVYVVTGAFPDESPTRG